MLNCDEFFQSPASSFLSSGSATSLLTNMSLGMILGTGVGVGIKMFSNSLRKLPLARRTLC
jgi:hypothetical protein